MPRPRKLKIIGFIPDITGFSPEGKMKNDNIIYMTLEELESIRLIDLLSLDQSNAAIEMNISRGTIQRMLNSARKKVADSLINGKGIVISGGNYKINSCKYICEQCGNKYISGDNFNSTCPSCGSDKYKCGSNKEFCKMHCNRHRG